MAVDAIHCHMVLLCDHPTVRLMAIENVRLRMEVAMVRAIL